MAYRVIPAVWLKTEADRVEAFMLMPKYWARTWTVESLKQELDKAGMEYSTGDVELIGAELVTRGIIEVVPV